jgi:hypothetical protein
VELLVIITILLIVARFALPVLFQRQWRAADHAIIQALGLPEEVRFIFALALVFGTLTFGIVRSYQYWHRRWMARQSAQPLPTEHGSSKGI